ncbi:molybdate transporter 1-like [Chenopodium quinoa]|uniref:Molybdate transporter 1 n=1 Tax=Chenopodium quinoa TaxID=63459 RepID=A0A803KXQ2_CHEQI|nr:molybdate transporter 1-like [Chenopodium quinoa]
MEPQIHQQLSENLNHQIQENPTPDPIHQKFPYNFWGTLKENLSFRSKWGELNGAMGDLGTYIPIVLALTLSRNLDLGTTLIFTGIYNIVTGAIYGIPMPVQPMKSIAAVAIANPDFGIPEVMAAGICTAGILFVLGVTQLMQLVYLLIPLSVVRGIQVSQGLKFAMAAVKYITKEQDFAKSKSVGDRPWLGLDGLLLAIVCACFIILVNGAGEDRQNGGGCDLESSGESGAGAGGGDEMERRRGLGSKGFRRGLYSLPSAVMIFLLGVILAFVSGPKEVFKGFKFGPSPIHVINISKESWKQGFIQGTIPQLPLSVLNSVIAVCKLSSDLFPGKDFSATSLSVTVGMMNLVGCWFGAIPTCHGAGGLAGQYKFGGRSGMCVALLGMGKLVIGVVLGSSIVKILDQFPVGVLGVLLLFAGLELAMACRDMNTKAEAFVMLLVTAVTLVGSGASLGFLCGIIAHFLLKLRILDRPQSFPRLWMERNAY